MPVACKPASRTTRRKFVLVAGAFASLALCLARPGKSFPVTPAARADKPGAKADAPAIIGFTSKIEDLQAAVSVTKFEPTEMEKIGKDFGAPYRIRHLTLQYKQPDKIRLEGKSPTLGTALMIVNGAARYVTIPKLRLRKTENFGNAPGKRQSLLEYCGLLSPDTLRFMQGRFVRQETLDEQTTLVFDLTYQGTERGAHYRLWIDPKTRVTLKREWYDRDNTLRATFAYLDAQEVAPNLWLPTRVEVRNAEGAVAAITTYSGVKINQGLDDSRFAIGGA